MKLSSASPLQKLMDTLPQHGSVCWIGTRPGRKKAMFSLSEVEAITQKGLSGDHYSGSVGSKRQISLFQQEHLNTIASFMRLKKVSPEMLRRNIVVKGINLLALKDKTFWVGEACWNIPASAILAPAWKKRWAKAVTMLFAVMAASRHEF